MNTLSVIIVNYKVKDLLLQCLECVDKASQGIDMQVFVVDNASGDGAETAVKGKFPNVKYIQNKENVGFAKANNVAIRKADSKYILLLNPDVLIPENCLKDVLDFASKAENFGALGVRMIDGDGVYLPESKRNKPNIWNSLCKISGLTKAFPKSRLFASYYNTELKENEQGSTDILAGAFMLINKEALGDAALLCEDYFMFGEDVDLSRTILDRGLYNYYVPITVIHLKGKSTNKRSKEYLNAFYGSMSIYYNRYHKSRIGRWIVRKAVNAIIWLKS
ncbi:MAG: glycosyltransferase family 2 protein [Paludibacteraceae bacterium]|nr:glycosyltransferase family 2 protein [Paludibacteraceae bacterium]